MRRFGIIGVYLFALAVWAQLLAPAAVARMEHAFDPFSVICAHQTSDGGSQPSRHSQAHHCCVLCHAYLGGATLDDRPVYTLFDYAVSSPLRWRLVERLPTFSKPRTGHRPRGPPILV